MHNRTIPSQPSLQSLKTHRLRWALCLILFTVFAIPSVQWFASPADASAAATRPEPVEKPLTWSAAGRVEPRDGPLPIAAPSWDGAPAIVTALHVRQGDWVTRGTVLAELRGRTEFRALLATKEQQVVVARARLAALTAGGKQDDIRALRAEIESDEAALAQIQADTARSRQLLAEGVISTAALQAQVSRQITAARALDARRARLSALSTVRPADISVATAELRAAEAEVEETRAREESTVVRAPADGRVLAVHTYPGQLVGTNGVLTLGKTREMFVDAEVAEQDLPHVHQGQRVAITGDVLPAGTSGTVEEIGYLVDSREVLTDPTAFSDARIVHVKIRGDDAAALERFINARVRVEIQP